MPTPKSHKDIDNNLLTLVEACITKIEENPKLLDTARNALTRWTDKKLAEKWKKMLDLPWPELKAILLDKSEQGKQHRQNVPFGGILSPKERYNLSKSHEKRTA
jgi:hypothetical protein